MRLYSGTSLQFVEDVTQNQIAEKLRTSFFDNFRYYPSPAEVSSWRNSLRAMSLLLVSSALTDHGIVLEYQLPLTSRRLDFVVCGRDSNEKDNAVIVELKQWEKCASADGDNEVLTYVGGAEREVLHPSVQVDRYRIYLQDTHTAFYGGLNPVLLSACTYLHNYTYKTDDVLFSEKFREIIETSPVFTADDVSRLKDYLIPKLKTGYGVDVLKRVEESEYRPSKKLMDHVGNIIKGKSEYILLDEQLIVYDRVFSWVKQGYHDKQKAVVIVRGGPGTGKSVIAINLMADMLLQGYNAQYATGSRAFTETLRKIIGARGSVQFKYFNSYTEAEYNSIDVVLADESHRIRETSSSRYTPRAEKSYAPQIEELIKAAKVLVCFIDDDQIVRPDEIGSVEYIKRFAAKNNCRVFEYQLEAQFRCSGSDAFVNWVNNTLAVRRTANVIWDRAEEFDFRIFSSPLEVETAIRAKVSEGFTGRVTAGFCWPWSKPNDDGTLKDDVTIAGYKRPWNARPEANRLAKGIPKALTWAYDPSGINQIGCVYTAQGFEFDYVGVIFGNDLVYDLDRQSWVGHTEHSHDTIVRRSGDRFTDLVRNTYRVLLTRGMKGCYVNFLDKDTERFFKSRMEVGRER
jgi:DUF2075 family protein